jgi:hypothetical protein
MVLLNGGERVSNLNCLCLFAGVAAGVARRIPIVDQPQTTRFPRPSP